MQLVRVGVPPLAVSNVPGSLSVASVSVKFKVVPDTGWPAESSSVAMKPSVVLSAATVCRLPLGAATVRLGATASGGGGCTTTM